VLRLRRDYTLPTRSPGCRTSSFVRMGRKALQPRGLLTGTETHVGWPSSKGVWVAEDFCGWDVDGVPIYRVERDEGKDGTAVRQTAAPCMTARGGIGATERRTVPIRSEVRRRSVP
jgi:hypothetical protein